MESKIKKWLSTNIEEYEIKKSQDKRTMIFVKRKYESKVFKYLNRIKAKYTHCYRCNYEWAVIILG